MHQYVTRVGGDVLTEELFGDRIVNFLYSTIRENAPLLFKLVTGARMSSLLGFVNFDMPLASRLLGNKRFLKNCGVNLEECVEPREWFTTPRRIFERKIRYWECRPMPDEPDVVVSPADARLLAGSFASSSHLFLKNKFFSFEDLIGPYKRSWLREFKDGDYVIARLTPDKYHYNHTPVTGKVLDVYELSGAYNACNPGAVLEMVTPYSQNRRIVTVIDTDVPCGTNVGLVCMIEVVALMIGDIVQCYSEHRYERPVAIKPGFFIRKGNPKSLYRPGSSTDILIFQEGRVEFADDILRYMEREDVNSRFSVGFGRPLVETDVPVRSAIARRKAVDNLL